MKKIFYNTLFLLILPAFMLQAQQVRKSNDNLKTVSYSVNMTCEGCKQTIGKMLAYEKGVKSFEINLEQKKVTVSFDQTKTDGDKISKAIQKLGYKVTPLTSSQTKCPESPTCPKPCRNTP